MRKQTNAMQTDILTSVILVMAAVFAGLFVALWRQEKHKRYILTYAYWSAAVATCIALQAWVIKDFGVMELVAYHALASSGVIALLCGVETRQDRSVPLAGFISVTALTGVLIAFARAAEVQMVVIMSQNFNSGLLFTIGAYACWMSGRASMADRALFWAFVLLAAYSIFRPSVTMVLASTMTMEEYQSSIMLTVNLAMTAILSLIVSLVLIATVITDRLEETKEAATQDSLTGLPTRGAFEPLAKQMLGRAASERVVASLIVGDIDHFKRINDTFGHAAGDRVISGFGALIAERIRPGDAAGRIGGEEFCIIAWNCTEEGACALADRLRLAFARIQNPDLPEGEMATASFGVAEFRIGSDYAQSFKRADAALYRAKRHGRNCVVGDQFGVFTPVVSSDDEKTGEIDKSGAQIVRLPNRQISSSS